MPASCPHQNAGDIVGRALAVLDRRAYLLRRTGYDLLVVAAMAKAKASGTRISRAVRLGGLAVRTAFIAILIVIVARVASPQLEHIWSVWETPSDVIRVGLGIAVCSWLLVHFFILPRDLGGYRTWLRLGPILLPLIALVAVVTW
jgi:hypothetical protein